MSISTDLNKAKSPEATRVSLPVSPAVTPAVTDRRRPALRGLLWALVSCLSFGASGTPR